MSTLVAWPVDPEPICTEIASSLHGAINRSKDVSVCNRGLTCHGLVRAVVGQRVTEGEWLSMQLAHAQHVGQPAGLGVNRHLLLTNCAVFVRRG